MFNLEEQIKVWRNSMSRFGNCKQADLDELESHLLDEIDSLSKSDLSQEESFLVASRRLGDSQMLQKEYGKINRDWAIAHKVFWIIVGVLIYSLGISVSNLLINISGILVLDKVVGETQAVIYYLLSNAFLLCFIVFIISYPLHKKNILSLKIFSSRYCGALFLIISFLVVQLSLLVCQFYKLTLFSMESMASIFVAWIVSNSGPLLVFVISIMLFMRFHPTRKYELS